MNPEELHELACRLQLVCDPPPGNYDLALDAVRSEPEWAVRAVAAAELRGYPVPVSELDFWPTEPVPDDQPRTDALPPPVTLAEVSQEEWMGLYHLHPCPWPGCSTVQIVRHEPFAEYPFGDAPVTDPHTNHRYCTTHAPQTVAIREEYGVEPADYLDADDAERERLRSSYLDWLQDESDAETSEAWGRLIDGDYGSYSHDDLTGML